MELQNTNRRDNSIYRNVIKSFHNIYDKEFLKLTDIQNDIVNFVDSGKQLYIHSSIAGNGKTS